MKNISEMTEEEFYQLGRGIKCESKEECLFYKKYNSCNRWHDECFDKIKWLEDRKREDPRFEYFNCLKFNWAEKYIKATCQMDDCRKPATHCREEFYTKKIYLCHSHAYEWDGEDNYRSQNSSEKYSNLEH